MWRLKALWSISRINNGTRMNKISSIPISSCSFSITRKNKVSSVAILPDDCDTRDTLTCFPPLFNTDHLHPQSIKSTPAQPVHTVQAPWTSHACKTSSISHKHFSHTPQLQPSCHLSHQTPICAILSVLAQWTSHASWKHHPTHTKKNFGYKQAQCFNWLCN